MKIKKTLELGLFSFLSLFLFVPRASAAAGDLFISPTTQIFEIQNAVPGGEYSSKVVTVKNNGSDMQDVQFQIEITTNPKSFSEKLYFKVEDDKGSCLWGYDCGNWKNLAELNFAEIEIGKIASGEEKKYIFFLQFDQSAGNEFQNAQIIFDMFLGYAGGEEELVLTTSEKHHKGDNDNDGGGDNDNDGGGDNDNLHKGGGRSLGANVVQASFQNRGAGTGNLGGPKNVSGKEGESVPGEVAGEQTGDVLGEGAATCRGWPKWIWILALVVFVGIFGTDAGRNYRKKEYGWKWALVLVLVGVVFWYFFDFCRQYRWFLYDVVILAIIIHFVYISFLKKKLKKQNTNLKKEDL